MKSVVPWTRSFDDQNLLLAINTDPDQPGTVWVDLDAGMLPASRHFTCLYSSDAAQIGQVLTVQTVGERQAVQLAVPAAGFVIFE
jgi:hypothetical protein